MEIVVRNGKAARPCPSQVRPRFEHALLAAALVSRRDLEVAAELAERDQIPLPDAIVSLGFASELDTYAALARAAGLPLVDLEEVEISPFVVRLVPEKVARRHQVVPIAQDGRVLTYAVATPFDDEADRDVAFASGRRTRSVLARPSQLRAALDRLYPQLAEVDHLLARLRHEWRCELTEADTPADPNSPVVRLCDYLVGNAAALQASDVHLEPGPEGVVVRYRIHGILEPVLTIPAEAVQAVTNRFKVMARLDIALRQRPQDGAFRLRVGERPVDVRLSTLPTIAGEKLVLRLIDTTSPFATIDRLGYPAPLLERLTRALDRPDGLVLVTGPTGSGKTTVLYAALNYLRTGRTNIVSVEDPVERRLEGVNQIPVNTRAGNTFAAVLRSVLRQDPNVIMVGEIRDAEVAQIVGQAAYTGHLVLSSLHTSDAASAVTRLVNLGLERFKIAESLTAIVAQRLVRRLCPDCKRELDPLEARRLGQAHGVDRIAAAAGPGCERCRQTGYLDRVAVAEILVPDEAIRRAILEGAPASEIRRAMAAAGCPSMREAALALAAEGITALEEIDRVLADEDRPAVPRPDRSRVLVVDDDRITRLAVKLLLEKAGYEVLEGATGMHAVELAARHRPDLLILDLLMPEMDGYQALARIRRDAALAMLPVIVITAENGPGAERKVLEAGADDYLAKPFDPEILLARVKGVLRRFLKAA